MEMTIREKLRYYPTDGDVLLYLSGKSCQVVESQKENVKVRWLSNDNSNVEQVGAEITVPVARIRSELIKNECFLLQGGVECKSET